MLSANQQEPADIASEVHKVWSFFFCVRQLLKTFLGPLYSLSLVILGTLGYLHAA